MSVQKGKKQPKNKIHCLFFLPSIKYLRIALLVTSQRSVVWCGVVWSKFKIQRKEDAKHFHLKHRLNILIQCLKAVVVCPASNGHDSYMKSLATTITQNVTKFFLSIMFLVFHRSFVHSFVHCLQLNGKEHIPIGAHTEYQI